MRFLTLGSLSLVMILLAVSCATPRAESTTALRTEEKEALLKRAKEPQVFGLTAYESDDGPIFAGAFRQHKGHIARIAFKSGKNTTTPVVSINGEKTLMLLDTAAAESWITAESSVSEKVVPLIGPLEKMPRHVYDTIGGFAGVLPKMTIDTLHVENAVLYIRNANGPLGSLTRWEKEPFLDGVLGADFIKAFKFVRISLRDRYIVLSATDAYPNTNKALATLPIVDLQGGIAVESMLDGEKLPILIDIAGDFEITRDAPASATMRQVSLGDVVFRQVQVDSTFELGLGLNTPPRIGRQLLERFDLVFNNNGTELLIEIPTP